MRLASSAAWMTNSTQRLAVRRARRTRTTWTKVRSSWSSSEITWLITRPRRHQHGPRKVPGSRPLGQRKRSRTGKWRAGLWLHPRQVQEQRLTYQGQGNKILVEEITTREMRQGLHGPGGIRWSTNPWHT